MKIGSDTNGEFTFIDIISLISLGIGLENLNENIDQNALSTQSDKILTEVHSHLQRQDEKIDMILEILKNEQN